MQIKSFSYDNYHVFICKNNRGYYFEICGYNDINVEDNLIYDSSDDDNKEIYFYDDDFEAECSARDYIDEIILMKIF